MKIKRITAALLALLTTLSLATVVGCKEDGEVNSSTQESVSTSSPSGDGEFLTPACTDTAKGHEFSEADGVCIRCGEKVVFPPVAESQRFPLVEPCPHTTNGSCKICTYQGDGTVFNRMELKEDCYTVELTSELATSSKKAAIWLSFSVTQPGQYALQTIDGSNGVTLTRHAANAHYVNEKGVASIADGENVYSLVNCGKSYFNSEWRATYKIEGEIGTTVKIRFIRIAEPAWEAMSIHTKVYPTEINGKKAEDMPEDMVLVDVPYESEYFYDDPAWGGDGYYHLGSKENKGDIIYVAINRNATRLFADGKFTNILQNSGTALNLNDGLTEDGNYNVLCYTPFIMNWKDEDAAWGSRPGVGSSSSSSEPEADPTKNAYQNYCNDDGVYPVNKELHTFLTLYVRQNKPSDTEISLEDWQSGAHWLWLSACYTYNQLAVGSSGNPIALTEGSKTVSLTRNGFLYFTLPGEETETETEVSYVLTCTSASGTEIWIYVGENPYEVFTEKTVTAPLSFSICTADGSADEVTITVTKVAQATE